MFKPIYPTPRTGAPHKSHDMKDWQGIKGDESRKVNCRFCGFICDPDRDMQMKDGSHAGKGVDHGTQQSASYQLGGVTVTDYYYEPDVVGGCPNCGSYLYSGKGS